MLKTKQVCFYVPCWKPNMFFCYPCWKPNKFVFTIHVGNQTSLFLQSMLETIQVLFLRSMLETKQVCLYDQFWKLNKFFFLSKLETMTRHNIYQLGWLFSCKQACLNQTKVYLQSKKDFFYFMISNTIKFFSNTCYWPKNNSLFQHVYKKFTFRFLQRNWFLPQTLIF